MVVPVHIVAYLALFAAVGFIFLFVNLLVGRFLRPSLPNPEKLEVYECGEPVIGSSFVQFDLRFYVVALLFIIFDVEVAFFFPWATVYGKATQLAAPPAAVAADDAAAAGMDVTTNRLAELGLVGIEVPATAAGEIAESARHLAVTSLCDIGVFFAVLMVGFAYVWKRGDLDWVRALSEERKQLPTQPVRTQRAGGSASVLSA